jgi:hypothetical protein
VKALLEASPLVIVVGTVSLVGFALTLTRGDTVFAGPASAAPTHRTRGVAPRDRTDSDTGLGRKLKR